MLPEYDPGMGVTKPYIVGGFDIATEFWQKNPDTCRACGRLLLTSQLVNQGYEPTRAAGVADAALMQLRIAE